MHPIGILLYPFFLVSDFCQKNAIASWGLFFLIAMFIACTPSWSTDVAYLPEGWAPAMAIAGLIALLPMTTRFWLWYVRAHRRSDGRPVESTDYMPLLPDFIPSMGMITVVALGMLVVAHIRAP